MSIDVSLGIGMKETRLSHEIFDKQIRLLIESKSLNDLEVKRLLLNPDIKFVPLYSNRALDLPSVSIVLPVYNDEDLVAACLETLVRQTYRNVLEILAVDDGSTDDSLKILKEFANTYPQLLVIESKHLGRSKTKNIGLESAKGQIIIFTESDAMYAPWYLEKAVDLCMVKNADAVMLQGSWILNNSTISKCILVLDQIKWAQISAGKKKIESAWVYKTEILRKFGGFNEKLEYGEDKDLSRRVISADGRIEYGTGYNWFHPTPNSLKQYLQRRFEEQRKKVVKHHNQKENFFLFLVMAFLIVTCLFIILRYALAFLLYFLLYALFFPVLLFYIIRLSRLLRESKNVSYRSYLFILPLISIVAIFPRILGIVMRKIR